MLLCLDVNNFDKLTVFFAEYALTRSCLTMVLYALNAKFIKVYRFGKTPEGNRTNFHFEGSVEGTEFSGKSSGIDYSVMSEGRINVHVHETISTNNHTLLSVERNGVSEYTDGKGTIRIRGGQAILRVSEPKFDWLNTTLFLWDADLDWNSRDFTVVVYCND